MSSLAGTCHCKNMLNAPCHQLHRYARAKCSTLMQLPMRSSGSTYMGGAFCACALVLLYTLLHTLLLAHAPSLRRYQGHGDQLQVENIKLSEALETQKLNLRDINEFLTNELKARSLTTSALEAKVYELNILLEDSKKAHEVRQDAHTHIHSRAHARAHTHTHTRTHNRSHTHSRTHTHNHTNTHTRANMRACTRTCPQCMHLALALATCAQKHIMSLHTAACTQNTLSKLRAGNGLGAMHTHRHAPHALLAQYYSAHIRTSTHLARTQNALAKLRAEKEREIDNLHGTIADFERKSRSMAVRACATVRVRV